MGFSVPAAPPWSAEPPETLSGDVLLVNKHFAAMIASSVYLENT